MINVVLQGRLGNHLFIYAACRRLALKHNAQLRFFISPEDYQAGIIRDQLAAFNIVPTVISTRFHIEKNTNSAYFKELVSNSYSERRWSFNPDVYQLPDDITLYGLFQSEKYFEEIEHTIREELSFKPRFVSEKWQEYRQQISQKNAVSVHVRRGDYVGLKMHNICTPKYFANGMKYMRSKLDSPEFFIFSDDIEWCRQQAEFNGCNFVAVEGADNDATLDLELMSLCSHHINSNSTYSWWGSWLNPAKDKIITVPERWFAHPALNEEAMRDTVIDNWIRLPV